MGKAVGDWRWNGSLTLQRFAGSVFICVSAVLDQDQILRCAPTRLTPGAFGGSGPALRAAHGERVGDQMYLADCGIVYVFVCLDCFSSKSIVQSG
jgi:hypothetical protein